MVVLICEQGDIISVNFDPSKRHEPAGRHYAIVISPWNINSMSSLTLVAPVTSVNNRYPLHVGIREENPITGYVQCEALRAIDIDIREQKGAFEYLGALDNTTMEEVMIRIAAVTGLA
ncbi:MAG: type II toxin-antitoxin system PemK/MazF family toxin [Coriobacteriales bacterium]|nr:type II toxin-antitoxin system PemK/MazF family toxin [Coriobacteriales bacterium]